MREDIKERIELIKKGKVPQGYKKTKLGIVPKDWEVLCIKDCLERVDNAVVVDEKTDYMQIGIRSHGKGIFYKEPVTGKELGNKRVFWVEPNCFVVNIVFAWEQAIGRTTDYELGMVASHRFPMYKPINNKVDVDYLVQYFLTQKGKDVMEYASPGGAGRNRTLGQDIFMRSNLVCPSMNEQLAIVKLMNLIEEKIGLQKKILEEKKLLRQAITQRLVGEINDNKVVLYSFNDIFKNISSKGHKIDKSDYQRYGRFPVVDQGKNKIVAFSNSAEHKIECPKSGIIVFGDHTRVVKYVDYDFIVGADGTQLLVSKNKKVLTKYLYYILKSKNIQNDGYSRHYKYIREYLYKVPSLEEQEKIIEILSTYDKEIELFGNQLEQAKLEKKAMMQLLLSGIVRVN